MSKATLLITTLLAVFTVPALADTKPVLSGYLGIQGPVLRAPDRLKDDSPQLIAGLRLKNLLGDLSLVSNVRHALRDGLPFSDENLVNVGCELPVTRDLLGFVTWERRFSTGQNRMYAGVRLNFTAR